MADGTFPAKYNFNLPGDTPTCTDFVVYGLNVAGVLGKQANLVGLTNLYSGTVGGNGLCGTDAATLKFAFNGSTIGGAINNSVTLSLDGTKVAYVESTATASALHVVTIPAGPGTGTVTSATTPASIVSITGSKWGKDSYSSIWVDYTNDFAYVGTDNGYLHKIQNVFCTSAACKKVYVAPSEVGTGWILTGAGPLTSPVQDAQGVIYVAGATTGKLYKVTTPAGVVTPSTQGFLPTSIVDGPILDVDGTGATRALYWFSNSTPSAAKIASVRLPQLVQTGSDLTQAFSSYNLLLNGTQSWGVGVKGSTITSVHAGTFDNAFYTSAGGIGNLWVCGWWQNGKEEAGTYGGNHHAIIRFGINGKTVSPDTTSNYTTSPDWVNLQSNTCAPLTEVGNSSVDYLFAGSQSSNGPTNCAANQACVTGYTVGSTSLINQVAYKTAYNFANYSSGMIADNSVDPTKSTCGPNKNETCGQAASIYFTIANTAIKLTQAALQ